MDIDQKRKVWSDVITFSATMILKRSDFQPADRTNGVEGMLPNGEGNKALVTENMALGPTL